MCSFSEVVSSTFACINSDCMHGTRWEPPEQQQCADQAGASLLGSPAVDIYMRHDNARLLAGIEAPHGKHEEENATNSCVHSETHASRYQHITNE